MIMAVGGAISLIVGVFGIFGSAFLGVSPWALIIFLFSGTGLLKYRKDTDVTQAEKGNTL